MARQTAQVLPTPPAVSSSMSFSDTAICSALYNNADEQIGNKVKYIQLRISAQEGVSS